MHITMSELNKKANAVINQLVKSKQPVTVMKHGKAIAEIIPINNRKVEEDAAKYLLNSSPVDVSQSIDSVILKGRERGI